MFQGGTLTNYLSSKGGPFHRSLKTCPRGDPYKLFFFQGGGTERFQNPKTTLTLRFFSVVGKPNGVGRGGAGWGEIHTFDSQGVQDTPQSEPSDTAELSPEHLFFFQSHKPGEISIWGFSSKMAFSVLQHRKLSLSTFSLFRPNT